MLGLFLIIFSLVGAIFYYVDGAIKPASQTVITVMAHSDVPKVEPSGEATSSMSGVVKSRVRLLSATQAELESLPRIGPVTAKAILDLRNAGKLKVVEDLDKVKGIGPKTLEQLRPLVEL